MRPTLPVPTLPVPTLLAVLLIAPAIVAGCGKRPDFPAAPGATAPTTAGTNPAPRLYPDPRLDPGWKPPPARVEKPADDSATGATAMTSATPATPTGPSSPASGPAPTTP
ncbi:MAG: hypothetical protein RLY86_3863 [Pseudomonadota bacterium]|jgi:hypothetical protein